MKIKTAKNWNWFFTVAHSVSFYYANKEGALKWIMSLISVDNASSIQLQHITLLLQHSQELLTLQLDTMKRRVSFGENVSLKQWTAILYIFREICSQKNLRSMYHWIALPWTHLCISIHFFSRDSCHWESVIVQASELKRAKKIKKRFTTWCGVPAHAPSRPLKSPSAIDQEQSKATKAF